jgi:hypothetical protein
MELRREGRGPVMVKVTWITSGDRCSAWKPDAAPLIWGSPGSARAGPSYSAGCDRRVVVGEHRGHPLPACECR